MAPFVATLTYQLMQVIPEASNDILSAISRNPLIFNQALESQFHELIIQILHPLANTSNHPLIIFIDGLDECLDRAHQANLVNVLGQISSQKNTKILFLVASRREAQIQFAFDALAVSHTLKIIPLDDSEASEDIRHFLNDKFESIKRMHPFRCHFPPDWPSMSLVSEIVDKSSGQFIFATVVMNFVSSDRANPVNQLK
ncbi:hypothetical protein BDN70DRAFT_957637, partial [Pholiota conissans]